MKKVVLLCVCMLTFSVCMGCSSQSYDDAADTDTTCSHFYSEATCATPKTCSNCGETEGEVLGHEFEPATFEMPSTCSRCGITTGEKLIPASEWGFFNLEEMGNALVEIVGYEFPTGGDGCVTIDRNCNLIKFENGYKFSSDISVENGRCVFGTDGNAKKYNVASNDYIDLNNGWDSFEIDERKTVTGKLNFVVFVENGMFATKWYVPYSLIDWNREAEVEINEESDYQYKLYLLP